MRRNEQVVERQRLYARFYGFETLFATERARRLELFPTVLRVCADCRGRIPPLQAYDHCRGCLPTIL